MYVMTKEQAQEWLNRPENAGVEYIDPYCFEGGKLAMAWLYEKRAVLLWFPVDGVEKIYRKTPWHWPKPDGNTPIDAKVWTKRDNRYNWEKRYMSKAGYVFINGTTSWSSNGIDCKKEIIVLANPDNLDEVPPMDLEV